MFSCLAHLRQDSITVREQQIIAAGQTIGALGNSGFSPGPHLHLHFMDSVDLLTASPLPITLHADGRSYAPQAGDMIAK
ncbi:M23 family metallopeptidase [Chloroflexus sp.]|uniref:M23 family metallopeptidase n=1 Tax=Chloroflexus sp. TaxID=1904827 RepID=UPI003A0FC86A